VSKSFDTLIDSPDELKRLAVEYAPHVVTAGVILLAGYFVTNWVGQLARRSLSGFSLDPPMRDLILRLLRLIVFALFALLALQNLGIDLLPLVAGLGILGAGVAFALQGVLGNAAAGLVIIFTRPFRVGEYISIAGEEGLVDVVSLFSTTLRHTDLSRVVIPNRKIAGEILHNYGEIRQLDLHINVPYKTALDVAIAAVREVLAANPHVLAEPEAIVQADALGHYAIRIAIRPWVSINSWITTPGEINGAVVLALRRRGIELPVPAPPALVPAREE
jgi:small conductance mechanosensitive channel